MSTNPWGHLRVVKLINKINRLRRIIREEGSPRLQAAWDEVEPMLDYFLQRTPDERAGD